MNNLHTNATPLRAEQSFFSRVMTFFGLAMLTSAFATYLTMLYLTPLFISAPWLMYVLFAAELGLVFTSRMWSKKKPLNRFLFFLFAALSGVTIAPLIMMFTSVMGVAVLIKVLFGTAFMFTAIAMIGWTTKKDLSGLGGFLTMGLIGLIGVGILGIFIPWGNTFELVYAGIGILIFTLYTAYDFQKLKSYPKDSYIDAALNIYLDMFNLLVMILRFILAFSRD